MKRLVTLGLGVLTSFCNAQVHIDKDVHVGQGAILFIDQNVNVTNAGSINNQGSTTFGGDITGESNIELGSNSSLTLRGGEFTSENEINEAFTNLVLSGLGQFTVPAGSSLTLTGDLDNQATGNGIVLEADATSYAQLLTDGTISNKGTIKAEQVLSAGSNAGWRQLSSPVSADLSQLEDDLLMIYASTSGSTPNEYSVYTFNASPVNPGGSVLTPNGDADAIGWEAAISNATAIGPANNGKPITVYAGDQFDLYDGGKIDVEGAVGNGDYDFDLYKTHHWPNPNNLSTQVITGWNFVPNPYPSNLDVSVLLDDVTNFGLDYGGIHVWDAKAQQYVAITDDIHIDYNTNDSLSEVNNIAPFQSFWVKTVGTAPVVTNNGALSSTNTITLTNAHRTVEGSTHFFKTVPIHLRLNVTSNKTGLTDQTIIAFSELYSDGPDRNEAYKLESMNDHAHLIATISSGSELSINRMSMPEPYKGIPMKMTNGKANTTYTVSLQDEYINPAWSVFLEDHKTQTMHNIKAEDYEFVFDPNYNGIRFTVHINKVSGMFDAGSSHLVNIYGNDNGINVAFDNPIDTHADIVISNLAGQILYEGNVTTGALFTFPVNSYMAVYVVRTVIKDEVYYQKVVR